MCQLLDVHRSGYYAWLKCPLSQRALENQALTREIKKTFMLSGGQFGSPRIAQQLRDNGIKVGENRVAKLMREANLNVHTVKGAKGLFNFAQDVNNVDDDKYLSRSWPNRMWMTDISYIETCEGWLYLAVVVDVFSYRVVGWSVANKLDITLTNQALLVALSNRAPQSRVVVYNELEQNPIDDDYQRFLNDHNLLSSRQAVHLCADNSGADNSNANNSATEQFFSALRDEHIGYQRHTSRLQAKQEISRYIEDFYNPIRQNKVLGFCSPMEYESLYQITDPKIVSSISESEC